MREKIKTLEQPITKSTLAMLVGMRRVLVGEEGKKKKPLERPAYFCMRPLLPHLKIGLFVTPSFQLFFMWEKGSFFWAGEEEEEEEEAKERKLLLLPLERRREEV